MAIVSILFTADMAFKAGEVMVYNTTTREIMRATPAGIAAPMPTPPEQEKIAAAETEEEPQEIESRRPAGYETSGGTFDRYNVLGTRSPLVITEKRKRENLTKEEVLDIATKILAIISSNPGIEASLIKSRLPDVEFIQRSDQHIMLRLNPLLEDKLIERKSHTRAGTSHGFVWQFHITEKGKKSLNMWQMLRQPKNR